MASNDFIGVDIQGIPELMAKLRKLPEAAQDAGVEEGLDYLLNVMRGYEPYKYVTRKSAYGVTFFSDAQRRYVMGAISRGEIDPGSPHRTQELSRGWKKEGQGRAAFLANEVSYAGYVLGDGTQSRHEARVGWQTISQRVQKHMSRLVTKFDAGVKKAIRKLRL